MISGNHIRNQEKKINQMSTESQFQKKILGMVYTLGMDVTCLMMYNTFLHYNRLLIQAYFSQGVLKRIPSRISLICIYIQSLNTEIPGLLQSGYI